MDTTKYANFIRGLEIVKISLINCNVQKKWDSMRKTGEVELELKFEVEQISHDSQYLRFQTDFSLVAKREDTNDDVFEFRFSLEVIYDISGIDISDYSTEEMDEIVAIFKERNVPLNCWPYAREFISSTTLRMGFPAVVIGTYKSL